MRHSPPVYHPGKPVTRPGSDAAPRSRAVSPSTSTAQPASRLPVPAIAHAPLRPASPVIQRKLTSEDAFALMAWAKKRYGDNWLTTPASQAEHQRLVLGCSSLAQAKRELDISAAMLNFKVVATDMAPPGFAPIFEDVEDEDVEDIDASQFPGSPRKSMISSPGPANGAGGSPASPAKPIAEARHSMTSSPGLASGPQFPAGPPKPVISSPGPANGAGGSPASPQKFAGARQSVTSPPGFASGPQFPTAPAKSMISSPGLANGTGNSPASPQKPTAELRPTFASLAASLRTDSPSAPAAKPAPATKTLKEQILGDLAGWEHTAKAKLSTASGKRLYPGAELTVCFMWKSSKAWGWAISGGGPGAWSLTSGKETVCAEDNLLRADGAGWKYSLAYDNEHRWKRACSNGCSKLLQDCGIEDLAGST